MRNVVTAENEKPQKQTTRETGPHGPVYREFSSKPHEAIDHLTRAETGEVPETFQNPHIGLIALFWGFEGTPRKQYRDGYGLAHIAKKHPAVINRLPALVPELVPGKTKGGNRLEMTTTDHRAIVGLDWLGQKKKWLLTAYKPGEDQPPPPEEFSGVPGTPEGGADTTAPAQGGPLISVAGKFAAEDFAAPAAFEPQKTKPAKVLPSKSGTRKSGRPRRAGRR
jgi:hypothetical protein